VAGYHAAHPLMSPPRCTRLEHGKAGSGMALAADQRGPACQMPMTLPAGSRMVATQRSPSG